MLVDLVGNHLTMPLLNATLRHSDEYKLCGGCAITRLDNEVLKALKADKAIVGGYENSVERLSVGLTFTLGDLPFEPKLSRTELIRLGIYCAVLMRLATGVPVDVPFWFDVDKKVVVMFGRTTIRTYTPFGNYVYILDDGIAENGLSNLVPRLEALIHLARKEDIQNRLVRAIDFASVGFQTRHTPTRLVNHVTFMETLFTTTSAEISFQLASAISWYLKASEPAEERFRAFEDIRDLYNARSRVVHGDDQKDVLKDAGKISRRVETLNTEIFNVLLSKNHIDAFSMSEDRRRKELRKLALGVSSAFG